MLSTHPRCFCSFLLELMPSPLFYKSLILECWRKDIFHGSNVRALRSLLLITFSIIISWVWSICTSFCFCRGILCGLRSFVDNRRIVISFQTVLFRWYVSKAFLANISAFRLASLFLRLENALRIVLTPVLNNLILRQLHTNDITKILICHTSLSFGLWLRRFELIVVESVIRL